MVRKGRGTYILRLQITVKNPVLVAKRNALAELVHKASYGIWFKSATLAMGVHVPLQILFTKLKNQDQLLLCMDDIMEADDVRVPKFLH